MAHAELVKRLLDSEMWKSATLTRSELDKIATRERVGLITALFYAVGSEDEAFLLRIGLDERRWRQAQTLGANAFISRITDVRFVYRRGQYLVRLTFANGENVFLSPQTWRRLVPGKTPRERFENFARLFSDLVKVDFEKRRIEPYRIREDVETARKLLDENNAVVLVCEGLGYDATRYDPVYLLARFVPFIASLLEKQHDTVAINPRFHQAWVTNPDTGKSFLAEYLCHVFGWRLTAEPPTRAYLVYDGGRKRAGIVAYANGIVMSEVDKWRNKQRVRELEAVLLDGMEQGVWTAGVSGGFRVTRCIPIVFTANVEEYTGDSRGDLAKLFANCGFNPKPLVERIAFPVVVTNMPRATDCIPRDKTRQRFLRVEVIRGVVAELQRRLDETPCIRIDSLRGRVRVHAERIGAVLRVLFPNADEQTLKTASGWFATKGWLDSETAERLFESELQRLEERESS